MSDTMISKNTVLNVVGNEIHIVTKAIRASKIEARDTRIKIKKLAPGTKEESRSLKAIVNENVSKIDRYNIDLIILNRVFKRLKNCWEGASVNKEEVLKVINDNMHSIANMIADNECTIEKARKEIDKLTANGSRTNFSVFKKILNAGVEKIKYHVSELVILERILEKIERID